MTARVKLLSTSKRRAAWRMRNVIRNVLGRARKSARIWLPSRRNESDWNTERGANGPFG